jgi:polyisoprenoid-binding protein YceI
MKKLAFVFLLFILFAFKGSQSWSIEPNYKINFTIGYFAGTCNGSIEGLIGNIVFDENDLKKSIFNFGVDLNTLKTGISKRDDHLKTADYFNIAKYPTIIFKSTTITKTTAGYVAEGNLTIKAVTKKVQLPFTFKDNAGTAVFSSKFKINRLDYFVGESTWKLKDSVSVSVTLPVKKL